MLPNVFWVLEELDVADEWGKAVPMLQMPPLSPRSVRNCPNRLWELCYNLPL